MFLGVLFGSDGILKLSFDDYDLTAKLCSVGLLFIIFYGSFCTKKIANNNVNAQAILLSYIDEKHEWLDLKLKDTIVFYNI